MWAHLMSDIHAVNIENDTAPTKWVIIESNLNETIYCTLIYVNTQISVQQRYILAVMMFLALGVTFAIRISFSLVLTQMVYIPNANESVNNEPADSNVEQICPVKYVETTSLNKTIDLVCIKFIIFEEIFFWHFFHIINSVIFIILLLFSIQFNS